MHKIMVGSPEKKKTNGVCICVYVCRLRFRIFCEVENAETGRTHKNTNASYDVVGSLTAKNCNLNVNLRDFRFKKGAKKTRCVFWAGVLRPKRD